MINWLNPIVEWFGIGATSTTILLFLILIALLILIFRG